MDWGVVAAITIVIFAFFFCMGSASVVALWYLKQTIKEIFEYLTEEEDYVEDRETTRDSFYQ